MRAANGFSARNIRITVLLAVLALAATFGIDYLLAARWDALLARSPKSFRVSLEADMCNAISGAAYAGPRYFLGKVIRRRGVEARLIEGRCTRGTKTLVHITQR